jgi:WD40 repeat protein
MNTSNAEQRLEEVMAAYLEADQAGLAPDRNALLAQHPEFASQLAAFFVDHDRLKQLAGPQVVPESAQPTVAPGETSAIGPGAHLKYFGDYELLEEIASGGMGVVYRARQVSLQRLVALKIILAGQFASPADVQRFQTEAEAAANMDHPHIVPIYEVGDHEGQHYFSMKLIEGISLQHWIADCRLQIADLKRNEQRDIAALVATVARAVHHAHQRGLLHRDLKPGNVLLQSDKSAICNLQSAIPFVTDFGLAKRVEGDKGLTQTGAIVGAPSYMAPEQATGKRGALTTAVDVYSLGAILYEMLTGRPPFRAETPLDTVLQVLEREPERPRSIDRRISHDLETICLKCLDKEPSRRYGSAEALAEDLELWRADRPIRARPVGRSERVLRWCKHNPVVAALSAVVLCSLFVAMAAWMLATVKIVAASREKDKASREKDKALDRAEGMRLAAQSELARPVSPTLALLLAIASAERHPSLLANNAMLEAMEICRQQRVLAGHEGKVVCVDFHPDGRRALTISADKTARIWDTATGEVLATLPGEEFFDLTSGRFSPDGRYVVTTTSDRTTRLWETKSGQQLAVFKYSVSNSSHLGELFAARFSPDGRRLLTGTGYFSDPTVRIYEVRSGKEQLVLRGHKAQVNSAAFSQDGSLIVTGALDETVRIWNATTGACLFTFKSKSGGVRIATFTPDGKHVFATGDGNAYTWIAGGFRSRGIQDPVFGQIWRVDTGTEVRVLKWSQNRPQMQSVSFSPDGKYLLAASFNTVDIFDIWQGGDGKPLRTLKGHDANWTQVHDARFSRDGSRIVTAANDNTARIWETATGKELAVLRGHTRPVTKALFSPDGRLVLTALEDHTAAVWDAATGEQAKSRKFVLSGFPFARLSADGRHLFVTHDSRWQNQSGAELWDSQIGQIRGFQGPKDIHHTGNVGADGARIAAGTYHNDVLLWDARSGRQIPLVKSLKVQKPGAAESSPKTVPGMPELPKFVREKMNWMEKLPSSCCFSPNGKLLLTTDGGDGHLWDAENGKELVFLPGDADHRIRSGCFSPDSTRVATINFMNGPGGGEQGTDLARIWDAASGKLLLTLAKHRSQGSVVYMADGSGVTKKLDSATMQPIGDDELIGQGNSHFAAFSPEPAGAYLLTDSFDNEPRVWDCRTGKLLFILKGHRGTVYTGVYSPDGRLILTASADGTARVWDASTGRQVALLKGHEDQVAKALFSFDGRLVLTGSHDRTARRWDAATGKELATYTGHQHIVDNVFFLGDGRRIVTMSASNARIWPIDILPAARLRKPRELTGEERQRFEIGK